MHASTESKIAEVKSDESKPIKIKSSYKIKYKTGPTGLMGHTGDVGPTGFSGKDGLVGSTGMKGEIGLDGSTGLKGADKDVRRTHWNDWSMGPTGPADYHH